jgi:hypothetical protein
LIADLSAKGVGLAACLQGMRRDDVLHPVLLIRIIRSDPKLFSGLGSGKNHSGSRQPGSGMNFKKTYLLKFTISQQNAQFKKILQKNSIKSFKLQNP